MLVVVAGAAAFVLTRPEDSSGPDQAGGPTTPTPNQTTPSPAFTRYAGDLEPLLLPVPSGAEGAQISFLEPGMTDAERISALWNPDEPTGLLGALERYRFVRGTDRAWTQGQEFVVVAILQFADPQRAREWYTFASTGAVAGLDTQGEIAGVSNGHYAVISLPNGTAETAGVVLQGEFGVYFRIGNNSADENLDRLAELATAQLELLPA